jgi:hypothetical protein
MRLAQHTLMRADAVERLVTSRASRCVADNAIGSTRSAALGARTKQLWASSHIRPPLTVWRVREDLRRPWG